VKALRALLEDDSHYEQLARQVLAEGNVIGYGDLGLAAFTIRPGSASRPDGRQVM
jgi:hypothetical protein